MASLASKDTSGTFSVQPGELSEVTSRRTRGFKVFALPDHPDGRKRYRVGGQIGPIHYRNDPFSDIEAYKEIDLEVHLTPTEAWDAACETNGFQVRLWQNRVIAGRTVRYIAQFRRGGKWIGMAPVALRYVNTAGQTQLISTAQAVGAPVIDNDAYTVTWANVFGAGIDFRYNLQPDCFFKTLIVRQKSALPAPTIGTAGLRLEIVMAVAWDANAKAANGFAAATTTGDFSDVITGIDAPDEEVADPVVFSFRDLLLRDHWWLQKPRAWDSFAGDETTPGPHEIGVSWKLRRKGSQVFALLSVPASALNAAQTVYPVFMDSTPITEHQVAASADDGQSGGGTHPGQYNYGITGATLYFGATTSDFYAVGLRFQTIPISQGATIDSAKITVNSHFSQTSQLNATVYCEDVDSALAFNGTNRSPYNAYAAHTTNSAAWSITAAWTENVGYDSVDISSPVGAVIGRATWVLDNNLVVLLVNTSTSLPGESLFRYLHAWDENGNVSGAKFNCSYTEGGPAGLSVSLYDAVTSSESIGRTIPIGTSQFDAVTVAEWLAKNLPLAVLGLSDTVAVAEYLVANLPVKVSLSDALAVAEWLQTNLPLPGVSLSDVISAAEWIQANLPLAAALSDNVTLTEYLEANLPLAGLSVADVVSVVEWLQASLPLPGLSLTDAIAVAEWVQANLPLAGLDLSDTVAVGEWISATLGAVLGLQVNLTDALAVAEWIATRIPIALDLHDSLTVAEWVSVSVPTLGLSVSLVDNVTLAEWTQINLPSAVSVHDTIKVSEWLRVSTVASVGAYLTIELRCKVLTTAN